MFAPGESAVTAPMRAQPEWAATTAVGARTIFYRPLRNFRAAWCEERSPDRRTAVSAVNGNRGRTANPWSQAGRLRSPRLRASDATERSPDRRTAVSAVNATVGEPPTRGRRRGRLSSPPSPKASAPEYSPVAALRTGVFLCGLFLMPLLGRAVSISFRSRRRYTAVSRPYG